MNWLVNELENVRYQCCVVPGEAVKNQIKIYFSGQKNDLNDAEAIAYLIHENRLHNIRAKSRDEMILQTLSVTRELQRKHKVAMLVSLKGWLSFWD